MVKKLPGPGRARLSLIAETGPGERDQPHGKDKAVKGSPGSPAKKKNGKERPNLGHVQ